MKRIVTVLLVTALSILPGSTIFSQTVPGRNGQPQSNPADNAQSPTRPRPSENTENSGRTYRVTIDSNIEGADIYINDRFMGEAPLTVNLRAGQYDVLVRLPKFQEFRERVTVNGPTTIQAELLRRTARLTVEMPEEMLGSGPWYQSNALSISIDGERMRGDSIDIPAGTHTIRFEYGTIAFEDTFEVAADQEYILRPVFTIELEPQGEGREQGLQLGKKK